MKMNRKQIYLIQSPALQPQRYDAKLHNILLSELNRHIWNTIIEPTTTREPPLACANHWYRVIPWPYLMHPLFSLGTGQERDRAAWEQIQKNYIILFIYKLICW